jgi:hypothetical protein
LLLPYIIILFLHLVSTNHKCTQPCYFPLLLRRRRWTGILRRRFLRYVLPQFLFLWSYGVFRCSVSLRVIIVFRDIIYIINILYLWHLVICEHFLSVCVEQLIMGIHTMCTWFWHKNRVRQGTSLSIFVSIYLSVLDYPSHPQPLFASVACYPFTSLILSFLHHPPILFWSQMTASTTPMTIATTMPWIHHLSISCWTCRASF